MSHSGKKSGPPAARKRLSLSGEAVERKPRIQVRKASATVASAKKPATKAAARAGKTIGLHRRNVHQGRYDMAALVATLPALEAHLTLNPRGEQTINFSDQQAVLCLNQALLQHHYGIHGWHIPAGYLCPPIPGRADYIHYAADLLKKYQLDQGRVTVLDIGTGANLIYPLLGAAVYQWQLVASDIDTAALENGGAILAANPQLADQIELRQQSQPQAIFQHLIQPGEHYQLTLCNPPFYASAEEAQAENQRKQRNLSRHQQKRQEVVSSAPELDGVSSDPWGKAKARAEQRNFGGQQNELWCEGGELAFLQRMARESREYSRQVDWFTSLVSKQDNVPLLLEYLKRQGAKKTEVVKMSQGQKISRFIAWCF